MKPRTLVSISCPLRGVPEKRMLLLNARLAGGKSSRNLFSQSFYADPRSIVGPYVGLFCHP